MTITLEFLKEKRACSEAIEYFNKQNLSLDAIGWVEHLIKIDNLDWANWFIVRCMSYKQRISYAVYAAKQVLPIYEKKHPKDKRPRKTIEAAEKCIKDPSRKNKDAAAANAANTSAYAAAANAAAARKKMRLKILRYGIKLLRKK